LGRFEAAIAARDDAPVTLTARIDGQALRALKAAGLRSTALARMLQVQVLQADLGERGAPVAGAAARPGARPRRRPR
jgi:hypothetical protein